MRADAGTGLIVTVYTRTEMVIYTGRRCVLARSAE